MALVQALLIAAFATAGATAFMMFAQRGLDREMAARSRASARVAAAAVANLAAPLADGSAPARTVAAQRLGSLRDSLEALRLAVIDREGFVIATSDPALRLDEPHPGMALHAREVTAARDHGAAAVSAPYSVDGVWYQAAWEPLPGGVVVGVESRVQYRASLVHLRQGVIAFTAFGILGAAGLGLVLSRRVTRPLERLSAAMSTAGPSALPQKAGVRGSDEVGRLGERFDELVDALERHDAELRALSATVAHEVRNPLGAITGYADMLERKAASPDTSRLVSGIREEIGVLDRVVSRFLSFAGDLRLTCRPFPLGSLLDDAVRVALPAGSRVTLDRDFALPGPTIAVDPEAMREVFVNLIRNAAQATKEQGTLGLSVVEGEDGVEVRVRDDGPGISAGIRPRLFQPFATTKADGTGLGLAISRRIVSGHRGTIAFDTSPSGTTFRVWLPRTETATTARG